MKNRLLLATLLAGSLVFAARCSENPAGPDAGSPDAAAEPPDAEAQDVGSPDTAKLLCDPAKCAEGNICVKDRCMLTCGRHTDCPDESYDCRSVEGSPLVCVHNGMPVGDGQFGYLCGAEAATCAAGFRCIGGKGDPSSYCAREGCATDQDCPGNYSCVYRDVAVAPDAGVDAQVAVITLCLKRGYCAPASGLVDCANANAVFNTDTAGRGWCLKGCNIADRYGCGAGLECVDTASGGQCWPRAMTCAPTQKFCGRCSSSMDCGPDSYCYTDQYSKEPMCLTPCSTDGECNVGALPTGRLPGVCDQTYGLCFPQETGFSQSPNGLSCWFDLCPDGTTPKGSTPYAGCKDTDWVDATAAAAERKVTGTVTELDGGVLAGSYTPKCLKIKIGQSVTFQPVRATLSDGVTYDFPLTQACGPIYSIGSLEEGVVKTIKLNKAGYYGYYEPYVDSKDGKDMAGAILAVP